MALINNGQILGTGSTDLILNTRGKIYVKVGDRFYELDFKNEGNNRESTVINNTTINNPEQDLSPYVTKKYLKAALGEYVTKRNWEDLMQTKEVLENAQLEGFTESITPITVNTMQMVVGTQNLQFDFITSLKDDTVVSPGLYINESGQLVCPRGFIKHYTLFGPQSIKPETKIEYYARWAINGDNGGDYALLDLDEKDKPYYVYLRVNTTGYKDITDDNVTQNREADPKGQNTGDWFVSTQSHAIDELEGNAYLLVALITGSNSGGRSIGYLNGFTEILPGQITAYVFKTADGNQYLDFLNNKFRIGNNDQYIDWNGESLTIKGSLSVIGGELKDTLEELKSSTIDIKYITDAIKKGRTDINGGLIMSGLIELGFGLADPENENYYDSFRVMSGMNGILKENSEGVYDYTDPAIWFGGDKLDIEDESDLLKPEACVLLIQENGTEYNKYLKDTTIEKPLYKWKREGQDSYYYSLTESGQPLVNSPKSDYPLQPISPQPSGNRSSFDMLLELTLSNTEFEDTLGNTQSLQGNIQAYRTGQTGGNYTVYDISSNTGKTLTGNFHKYIVSSHEQNNQGNAVNLTGTEILAYLPDNSNIEGIIFTVGRVKYYIECSATPQEAKGFLYVMSSMGSNPLVYVYKDSGSETFTLYGWKCDTNYIYTLDDYNIKPSYIYALSDSGDPYYTTDYTIIDHSINLAKAMFRMNGSGYLANGNISWNTDGKLTLGKGTMSIDPNGAIDLGYLHSDDISFWIGNNEKKMLEVSNNGCKINGSLSTRAESYYDGSFISVEDSSGTNIIDIGSAPLSTAAIPTYIRQTKRSEMFYQKGPVMWGKVTIPDKWEYQITDWYTCFINGELYKLNSFNISYEFSRVSKPITLKIILRKKDIVTGENDDSISLFTKTFNVSKSIQGGEINVDNLESSIKVEHPELSIKEGIRMEGFYKYSLVMKLSPGQVQSSIASDSWISIKRDIYEVEITRTAAQMQKGTFIRPNGISSVFGQNSKFQWLGAMSDQYTDYRDQGGTFIVALPATSEEDNATNVIGLELTGYMDSSANGFSNSDTPGIRINLGDGWYKLKFDNDGILRKV